MAIESVEIRRAHHVKLFNVAVHEADGTVIRFPWNKDTGMAGLKARYLQLKEELETVDQELEDLKVQALAELKK